MKNYRPEIDGLRALAVLSVIIYHGELSLYNFKLLEGGFLGVDVFFVVSGYLITSLILNDINLKGKFSYLYFYERRARRILPALLIIILTFLPISYFLLLPNEFEEFSKSILYTLGFGSNFYFYYSGLIYGAENGLLKPLLHTWSLSVEEQYYLIFPIIILLFIKLFKNKIIYVILFCLFVSLIYAHWNAFHNPSLNFYSLLSRGWELLAGSLLAFLETKYNRNLSNKYLKTIFPSIGLLLIFHGLLFYNDQMPLPSFYSLNIVVGVCLIVWFSNKSDLLTKILSSNFLVGIGLISYSLYLWHYPLFSFTRLAGHNPSSISIFIILFIITIILSVLTFFFIERPFRKLNFISLKNLIIIISILLLILMSFSFYVLLKKGNLNSKNIMIEEATSSALYDDGKCKFSTKDTNFIDERHIFTIRFKKCLKEKNKKFILIIGDSHGEDIFNSISMLSNYDFIIGLNQPSCRPINKKKCIYNHATHFAKINKENIKAILFTQKGSYMLTDISGGKHYYDSAFRKLPLNMQTIKLYLTYYIELKKIHQNSLFIGPHIEPNIDININIYSKMKSEKLITSLANFDITEVDSFLKEIKIIDNIDFNYISKIDQINYDPINDFIKGEKIMFSDKDHWSKNGELYFGKKLFDHPKLKSLLNQ